MSNTTNPKYFVGLVMAKGYTEEYGSCSYDAFIESIADKYDDYASFELANGNPVGVIEYDADLDKVTYYRAAAIANDFDDAKAGARSEALFYARERRHMQSCMI